MENYNYYDILGVSIDATLDEITLAKNNLAKIYHPDANLGQDTTWQMQSILEAYQVLRDEIKKKEYDNQLGGPKERRFNTYSMEDSQWDALSKSKSFLNCWQAAQDLFEAVEKGVRLLKENVGNKHKAITMLNKLIHKTTFTMAEQERFKEIKTLMWDYISILSAADIPMSFWHPNAMNWVFVRWGQKQSTDYILLFHRYQQYIEVKIPKEEKKQILAQSGQYQKELGKLIAMSL